MLKSLLHLSNAKVRLLVGLFLASLFCIQCTKQIQANREPANYATAISGQMVGKNSKEVLDQAQKLAKTDHVALLQMCLEHYRNNYRDFTCVFQKQERINGQLGKQQEIEAKFMDKPFSVAMLWIKNQPSLADRMLYVEGKWDNQMMVRPAGLLAFVGPQFRPPDGPEAMKNTLRPVSLFGFERSIKSLIDVYCLARKNGESKEQFGDYAQVNGRETLVLVRYLPPKSEYPAVKTLTYIDLEYLVPIMVEGYDQNKKLTCRYLYKDVKFNVGLTGEDFLPQANGMAEPK